MSPQQPWPEQTARPASPVRPSTVPLLVLGVLTAVLGLLGTVLPTYRYAADIGFYAPLVQVFDGRTTFQAQGLVLVLGLAVLVTGAALVRSRTPLGTGLLLVGAGMFVEQGGAQFLALAQSVTSGGTGTAAGGVLLVLAGAAGIGTAAAGIGVLVRTS